MRYYILCFLLFSPIFATASDDTLLKNRNQNYGSIQQNETISPNNVPFPFRALPEEVQTLVIQNLCVEDQLSVVKTCRYFYEGLYDLNRTIMYSSEVISFFLIRYLSKTQDLSFSDTIPVPLGRITFFLKRAKTNKDILDLLKENIHEFRQVVEEKQYAPTILMTNSTENLDYLIQFDEDLSKDNIPQTKSFFRRLMVSIVRDRRFMVAAGFVSLGTLVIIGYFVTKSPIEAQAYSSFMNQTQIPPFYGYGSDYLPNCFRKCSLQGAPDGFYVNPPQCDGFPGRGCPCDGYVNSTCYGVYDPICPDGGCWDIVPGNVPQWLDYFSSQCNFTRHSGYWVNYIQEIINGTRPGNDNSTVFQCVPSENNQSIVCGKSYSSQDSWRDSCDQSVNGICMHLYVGSAQCAADLARYKHLVNYFAPTSVFMFLAVVSTLIYWYWW